ncbi:haloalkane dehalogenase [Sedimentitalea sp. CY04]|uniref:Haloalkane dehalogenase n=1 Tax=Parasedimentitalea denitrificans TaxID=2211118 RepID=A0ABX0WD54_9RHOB|nr:haloalkane dehalogenase [Sedimentitalea sp. CY04]NIZ63227.1 haloalkane dehalogenase [Sedimentitalea sp. CY04]
MFKIKPTGPSRRTLLKSAISASTLAVVGGAAQSVSADETKPYGLAISSDFPFTKKSISVEGSEMAYVDEGEGQPVLFLHGNPTSSYLWRNIIPYVTDGYRAIAPDLIGMGDSGKPNIGYTFEEHATYLDGLIKALGLKDIILVIHDWGSALGMRYARLNSGNVSAMAFMEAIVPPAMPAPSYEAMGPLAGELFKTLRTPGVGEEMVLKGNFFVEKVLAEMGVVRGLSEAEMEIYRAPYATEESRLPTLQWPREIPIGGEPQATTDAVTQNGAWLMSSEIPKLLFYAEPGALMPQPVVDYLTAHVTNLETRFVGPGTHFLQEDHPHLIGRGLADWLRRL